MGVNGVALVVCSQFGGENTWVEGERSGASIIKKLAGGRKKTGRHKKFQLPL